MGNGRRTGKTSVLCICSQHIIIGRSAFARIRTVGTLPHIFQKSSSPVGSHIIAVPLIGHYASVTHGSLCFQNQFCTGLYIFFSGQSFLKGSQGISGVIWPLFFTGVYYLVFTGILTLVFGRIEKKLGYFR